MARQDTRSYAERKARGEAERHRYKGKTVRGSDEFWAALEKRAEADASSVNQVIRDAVAKHLGQPELAD
jgi:hypothetical protein